MSGNHIVKRGEIWHYARRVPRDLVARVGRDYERRSLKTEARSEALSKASAIDAELDRYWQALRDGADADAEVRHQAIVEIAQRFGYAYRPLAELRRDEIVERALEGARQTPPLTAPDRDVTAALLGGSKPPAVTAATMLPIVERLQSPALMGKNARQMSKWRTPRERVCADLRVAVGERPIDSLAREDLLRLSAFYAREVGAGAFSAETANRYLNYLGGMLTTLADAHGWTRPSFRGVRLPTSGRLRRRPAITRDEIDRLLTTDALARLNAEARRLLYVLIATGARPSEIAGLMPSEIRLDAPVPHIRLRYNENRALKTPQSERDLPLVGPALAAMAAQPHGFPRYAGRDSTAAINKFLRENDLVEGGVTSYGCRHQFETALRRAGVEDRIRALFFGHRHVGRPQYGDVTLDEMAAIVGAIGYPAPMVV